ncbi:hypothetical protein AYM40_23720 [Paraburkholderia phytofirmans OLGA172]|uniref:Uncharacterized protein n=1 Tax=Paraburkholderia phytofirmans OLGA172 TaxID=1417228 RepID=A0A160FR03_9BURK|nr:hypothetical protein AYM40_23720 [Paraburkholderia phytofirmans OLGA172]
MPANGTTDRHRQKAMTVADAIADNFAANLPTICISSHSACGWNLAASGYRLYCCCFENGEFIVAALMSSA